MRVPVSKVLNTWHLGANHNRALHDFLKIRGALDEHGRCDLEMVAPLQDAFTELVRAQAKHPGRVGKPHPNQAGRKRGPNANPTTPPHFRPTGSAPQPELPLAPVADAGPSDGELVGLVARLQHETAVNTNMRVAAMEIRLHSLEAKVDGLVFAIERLEALWRA